jgi:hypothetical protein
MVTRVRLRGCDQPQPWSWSARSTACIRHPRRSARRARCRRHRCPFRPIGHRLGIGHRVFLPFSPSASIARIAAGSTRYAARGASLSYTFSAYMDSSASPSRLCPISCSHICATHACCAVCGHLCFALPRFSACTRSRSCILSRTPILHALSYHFGPLYMNCVML